MKKEKDDEQYVYDEFFKEAMLDKVTIDERFTTLLGQSELISLYTKAIDNLANMHRNFPTLSRYVRTYTNGRVESFLKGDVTYENNPFVVNDELPKTDTFIDVMIP